MSPSPPLNDNEAPVPETPNDIRKMGTRYYYLSTPNERNLSALGVQTSPFAYEADPSYTTRSILLAFAVDTSGISSIPCSKSLEDDVGSLFSTNRRLTYGELEDDQPTELSHVDTADDHEPSSAFGEGPQVDPDVPELTKLLRRLDMSAEQFAARCRKRSRNDNIKATRRWSDQQILIRCSA